MLEIGIEKRLGDFQIDVELSVEHGITALFGRSGAGKSSIANMVAGLLRPDHGVIRINRRTVFDDRCGINLAPHKRNVGYVFQDSRLFPRQTVAQNLLFGRRFRRLDDGIAFGDVAELLGLSALLTRRPANLSGGERQRVAIGRAVLSRAEILIMDEPLASLDGGRRSEILPYIERLRDQYTLAILYISHAIEEVARLATTLILLEQGRVIASGRPEDLLTRLDLRPLTGRYQAGAVITGLIDRHAPEDGLSYLRFAGGVVAIPLVERPAGDVVKIRILARDVAISLERTGHLSIQNQLPAKILSLNIEESPFAEIRLDLGGDYVLSRITASSARRLQLRSGQQVIALIKSVSIETRT